MADASLHTSSNGRGKVFVLVCIGDKFTWPCPHIIAMENVLQVMKRFDHCWRSASD
jgi:hypothetical protein